MTARIAAEICAACGGISLEQRGFCAVCGSHHTHIGAIDGRGVIWSITRLCRHASAQSSDTPFDIAIVALTAGPHIMIRVPDGLHIGDPVAAQRTTLTSVPALIDALTYLLTNK